MQATTTCTYTMSTYAGTNDSYPYTSASVCSTIGTSTDLAAIASSTQYIGQPVLVADFFLFLIFVVLLTAFILDRAIGIKGRLDVFNSYIGNNSREGKKLYHD